MPFDEETKVFDVARPNKAYPDASSKPVIAGHRPEMNDPMVKEGSLPAPSASGTPIHVSMHDEEPHDVMSNPEHDDSSSDEPETHEQFHAQEKDQEHGHSDHQEAGLENHEEQHYEHEEFAAHDENSPSNTGDHEESHSENKNTHQEEEPNFTSLHDLIPREGEEHDQFNGNPGESYEPSQGGEQQHIKPLSIPAGAGPKKRWPKVLGVLFLLVLFVVAAGFFAIDYGLVKSDIKLPFHIFNNQKTSKKVIVVAPTPPPIKIAPPPTPSTPDGFTVYKLSGTAVSLTYPAAWGEPAVTTDLGFSKRGGANKTDGTYAYLVNFATNKEVQLAFTSSKYLPAVRGVLYYDYLQWCVGTNDGKYYKQSMHFTTSNKVDSPGTIACDQGPLADATKIDNSTIVQPSTKDAAGKIIGDLYTHNLSGDDLTVLRAKDTTSKNSDNIKTLLSSVKTTSSTTP
jgi:hypothetical protein